MRFMMLMIPKGYENAAPGTLPDAKAVAGMMKYNKALQQAGVLLSLDGLHPPSMGVRVSFAGGKPAVTDGPFAEAKEVLGGYWMIDVKSKDEAIEWAKRCPASDNEVIEIRQVQEIADFPDDVQRAAAPMQANPYIFFDGQCETAFNFYAQLLGGKIDMMLRAAEAPGFEAMPAEAGKRIMYTRMTFDGQVLMGSDWMADQPFEQPQGFYVSLSLKDRAKGERIFNSLAEGGRVRAPFGQTFFASGFGMLVDRFGIPWLVNCE